MGATIVGNHFKGIAMFESTQSSAIATSEAITAAPKATAKITGLAFGDKGALARTLTSKGAEKTACVLAAALLPVASNRALGHGTFKTLVSTGAPDKGNTCPLQAAIAGLKGKAAQARHAVFSMVKACTTQDQHDALMLECETALMLALAPTPKAAPAEPSITPTMLKAQLATITAERDALALEIKALKATLKAANVAQPARTPVDVAINDDVARAAWIDAAQAANPALSYKYAARAYVEHCESVAA